MLNFDVQMITVILGLVVIVERLIDAFVMPLFEKFSLDTFWVKYIAWVMAGLFVAATGMNLFAELIPSPLIGLVLTAIVGGGGANILHDVSQS